jgi:Arc/MetJ-type ribon-helix-helix transcriptional regulator
MIHMIRWSVYSDGRKDVNITVDPETVRLADREARRRKTSRSEFIRSAVREVATNHERQSEEGTRQKRRHEAVETMNRLAHEFGDWPAEQILRASRDRWAGRR